MTDYRMRNHDLLYADRNPQSLGWRNIAIFGAIGVTVLVGVVSHLVDRFNMMPPGFPANSATVAARPAPLIQLANPAASKFGS
jgi:hypothetical protein